MKKVYVAVSHDDYEQENRMNELIITRFKIE